MWIFPRPVDDQLAVRPQLGDAVQPLHIGKEPRQIGTAIIMEADQRAAWPYVDLRNACLHAVHLDFDQPQQILRKIGRASCRERVCQYVEITGGAVTLKKT